MAKNGKPSIKMISEMTGFSPATISNALNNKKGVNKETSDRIFQVAEAIGYALPAAVAPSSVSGICFVVIRKNGEIIDESAFHSSVIEGLEQEARSCDLETRLVHLNCTDHEYEEDVQKLLYENNSALVILATEMDTKDFDPFRSFSGPIILLDGWDTENGFSSVLIDNQNSAHAAVDYLIRKGHRHIGHLKGNFRINAFKDREAGYQTAMLKHGLKLFSGYEVPLRSRIEEAYLDMKAYLKTDPKIPTAYFADNDLIAIGAMKALTEAGYSIPEDVSIVGFDDLPYSAITNPPLSTVWVDKQELGREAVRRIKSILNHGRTGIFRIAICTSFIERDSVRTIDYD